MNRYQHSALLAVYVAAVALSAIPARAGEEPAAKLVRSAASDWPQWRGPRRDGVSDETGLLVSWPEGGPKRLWTASGIGRGYSSPIVVGDSLYITGDEGDDLAITAFSLDGSRRWRTTNGRAWKGPYPGARASCTYDAGKLYHLNAHGRLVCLDAATGAEAWTVNILERFQAKNILWGLSESVLVHGDRVFATPGGPGGLMAALDKRSGKTVWTAPPIAGEEACYSSPILLAVGPRLLLVNCGARNVFGVDAQTGELLWQVPHVDPKNTLSSTPVLAEGDGLLVFTDASRDYGAVFGLRLDALPARRVWMTELSVGQGGLVCMAGGLVGSSGRGDIKGWVTINAATGKTVRVGELPGGSSIYADGRFYCLSERGTMALQELTSQGFQDRGSFRLAEQRDVWAHPVICKGRLYLRCHETLFCYDVRGR